MQHITLTKQNVHRREQSAICYLDPAHRCILSQPNRPQWVTIVTKTPEREEGKNDNSIKATTATCCLSHSLHGPFLDPAALFFLISCCPSLLCSPFLKQLWCTNQMGWRDTGYIWLIKCVCVWARMIKRAVVWWIASTDPVAPTCRMSYHKSWHCCSPVKIPGTLSISIITCCLPDPFTAICFLIFSYTSILNISIYLSKVIYPPSLHSLTHTLLPFLLLKPLTFIPMFKLADESAACDIYLVMW